MTVTVCSEDGRDTYVLDLRTWPGPLGLRQETAEAYAVLTGPAGAWRSIATVTHSMRSIRAFLSWCQQENLSTLAELTPAMWAQWRMHVNGRYAEATRFTVLRQVRAVLGAAPALPDKTRGVMLGRLGAGPRTRVQPAYTEAEFRALQRAAQGAVYASWRRITANHRLALRHSDMSLSQPERTRAAALHALLTGGAPATREGWRTLGAWAHGKPRPAIANRHLFLDVWEALACAVLLICHNGSNISTLARQVVASTGAGEGEPLPVLTAQIDKPRRGPGGRHFAEVSVDDGEDSAGRAVSWVQQATEPARQALSGRGTPTDRLLVYVRFGGFFQRVPKAGRDKAPWLPDRRPVNLAMLHRTYQTRINPAPTHNTRDTHVDSYLLVDGPTRAHAQADAAAGFDDAIGAARNQVRLRLLREDDVNDYIRSGRGDTVVAACGDIHHHPVTGTDCTESFLLCLACPNAVATPRHLPRLVLIHEALEQLRSAVDPADWRLRWQPHYLRLHGLLTAKTTPAQRRAALAASTTQDRRQVDALLRGEFNT